CIAEIRPQVNGTILKRQFKESSYVKAGQSLYLIDPAIYQANYNKALADLSGAKATAGSARSTANRYASLVKQKAISRQEYDNALASAKQAEANVKVAQAAVNTAKVNLDYTKVYSPIEGYIGKSSVTEGALVTASQANALATVQQLDPIYVDITQSIDDYIKQRNNIKNGLYQQNGDRIEVDLVFNDGTLYKEKGYIEFSELDVNETTGSIVRRATFPNPEHLLLPGMFVKPYLIEGTIPNAILIPQKAVTRDASGKTTVKLVKEDNQVITQEVIADRAIGANWLISKGLQEGDRIVTSGLMAFNSIRGDIPVYANIIEPKKNANAKTAAQPTHSKTQAEYTK